MNRQALDIYDEYSDGMSRYLQRYGWHFNQKLSDFAVSNMRRKNVSTGVVEKIEPITRQQYEDMMRKYSITLDNDIMCDGLFVANMCKSDYLKKSVTDEQHMAMYVKDTIDDVDAGDGTTMRRWYATMCGSGMPIDWNEML